MSQRLDASYQAEREFLGLWIIEKQSGLPICCVNPDETDAIDSTLFGGFLAALRGMSSTFQIGELDSFQTKTANLLMTGSETVFSVIAIDKQANTEGWYPTLQKVQQLVEDSYTSNADIVLNTDVFEALRPALNQIVLDRINTAESSPIEIRMTDTPTISLDTHHGDLEFLIQYFPNDLGKLIYTLLLEEPVLLIGDIKEIVHRVMNSIEILIPHRVIKSEFAMEYTDPLEKDLIIMSSQVDFLEDYDRNITRVFIDDRKIISKFKRTPSIDNMLSTLRIAPTETQETVIHGYIGKLMTKSGELMKLCQKENVSRSEIKDFRANLKADELNIIISKVSSATPQYKDKLFHVARSFV